MGTFTSALNSEIESEESSVSEREQARKRLQERRDFGSHLVAYVVVNAFLIGVWAMTGAGYFWPAWVLAGWGVGLVLHAWEVFFRRPITEADIDEELGRGR
jgi:ABC-type transport system involved in cytochrome bd biosynthesis fused ATPase/permease subunit